MAPPKDPKKTTLVVSIDFGATASGFAFVQMQQTGKGSSKSVPSPFGPSEKQPTSVYIPSAAGSVMKSIPELVKLALMNEGEWKRATADPTLLTLLEAGFINATTTRTSVELVSLVLDLIWDAAMEYLTGQLGSERVDMCEFHAVFSHPHLWAADTLARFEAAVNTTALAKKVTDVAFVSESVAAAYGSLWHHSQTWDRMTCEPPYIIADCGGITIDTAVCTTRPSTTTQPNITDVHSRLCGSLSIDLGYSRLLSDAVLKHSALSTTGLSTEVRRAVDRQFQRWRAGSRNLSFGHWGEMSVYARMSFAGKQVDIHRDDIINIFDRVADAVIEMISSQFLESAKADGTVPKTLVLCGGLSLNPFFRERLQLRLETHFGAAAPTTPCEPSNFVNSFVCRGAALFGAQSLVRQP